MTWSYPFCICDEPVANIENMALGIEDGTCRRCGRFIDLTPDA